MHKLENKTGQKYTYPSILTFYFIILTICKFVKNRVLMVSTLTVLKTLKVNAYTIIGGK